MWDGYPIGDNPIGDYEHVFARRFDVTGTPISTEFQVNSAVTSYPYSRYQRKPAVGMNHDGSFVVVWEASGQ